MARPNLFAPNSPEGAGLNNLVMALYSGDGEAKRAEREAMLENRRLDTQIKRNAIEEHARKRAAEDAAKRAEAETIASVVRGLTGGGDPTPVMDYRKAGGVVAPQPETAEMPGIIGGYGMDRPPGYTPEIEGLVNRLEATQALSRGLPGKTNAEQAVKAAGSLQQQRSIADVLSGLVAPEKVAPAYAAVEGKPLYSDESGRVLAIHTGALNESGAQARAGVTKTQSETTENLAQAARARREGVAPVETVADPTSPTGLRYALRSAVLGQPAPPRGATAAKDVFMPTTPNVTAGQKDLNNIAQTRSVINRFMEAANADERNFGFSGFVRETAQDAMQQGKALGLTVGGLADQFVGDINRFGHEVGVENFDKNLPLLDLYANVLAFQMAQTLAPGDRVTDQDYKRFRAMIGDSSWLGNQRAVKERIDGILAMVDDKERTIRSFLAGGRNAPAAPTDIQIPPPAASGGGARPTVSNW